jgi:hypothetical protein
VFFKTEHREQVWLCSEFKKFPGIPFTMFLSGGYDFIF